VKQNTSGNKTLKRSLAARTQRLIDFDNVIRQNAIKQNARGILCGVDEAGRGPVAGPVVAAAVIFSDDVYIEGVFDSKQVPLKKREELYEEILSLAVCYGVGIVHSAQIDTINILNATKMAMNIAVSKLSECPCVIIADGNFYHHDDTEVQNIVKADEKSFTVAASSIIAKVTRDRIMCEYQNQYPNYTFSSHKGYCTIAHIDEIMEYGYTEIHRRSFKLKAVQGELFES
jgi:ribonuclease HII